jgi:NTE family protein
METSSPERSSGWLRRAVDRVREFAYTERPTAGGTVRPRIGFALGGGFARGIAHLGVLNFLAEQGIPIDYIVGTSAGAVAGLAYSTGLPFEIVARKAGELRFANFGQWKFSWLGLASNKRLESYPKHFLGVTNFEELKIPLSIAATDLHTGELVWFNRGPIGPPLRASCAYPGLFQPVEYDGKVLIDGFVAATVPVEAALQMGADMVIAVLLEAEEYRKPANFTDVLGRSFAIIQRHADVAWRSKAHVLITPVVHEFAWDDFSRAPEIIEAGRQAATDSLPKIMAAIEAASKRIASAALPVPAGRVP